jgi:hypothetical protein
MVNTAASAVDTVEAEVRELVRRRGLDPVQDPLAMRRLIDEVVLDYDERALSSTMPVLPDPRLAARVVFDTVAGFGPLQRHLDDPEVEEIWINDRPTAGSCRAPGCSADDGGDPLRADSRPRRWAAAAHGHP